MGPVRAVRNAQVNLIRLLKDKPLNRLDRHRPVVLIFGVALTLRVLFVLWLLGVVSGYTMGNFIYVLLVVAIVLFLVRLISGRRVV